MTTGIPINIDTATEWLKNHYKGVPGVWEQFGLEDAAELLVKATIDISTEMCGDEPAEFRHDAGGAEYCKICCYVYSVTQHWWKGDYSDLPTLELMCIMAASKM